MNDDFLHRIRAEPPPHFIASLKARLNQLDKESLTRVSIRRRIFFIGSMYCGSSACNRALRGANHVQPSLKRPATDSRSESVACR